jgi:hypothetical protein
MSSRALRKVQREQEEQKRVKQLGKDARILTEDEEAEDYSPRPLGRKSAFAMLGEEQSAGDDADEDDEIDAVEAADELPGPMATLKSAPPKTKKRKKKGKGKANASAAQVRGLDEIDAALEQLSFDGKVSLSIKTVSDGNKDVNDTCRLLSIDLSHLHVSTELRRLFGRAALEHDDDDHQAQPGGAIGGNRRQQRRNQQIGLAQAVRGQRQDGRSGLSALALRRNIFIQSKEEWPAATGGGLGMDIEEKCADGTVLYRFVHTMAYQDVQNQFQSCVASMDPNRMVVLLQHNPYHISTLLQVSEIAKQERDHTTSGDLLERALFSFGRALHSTFNKNLSEGTARLDFRRPENREFWLATWRYCQNLKMRGTWRTLAEWTKLLISLSPESDPYALWLVLDQYALRSRQDLDYLNISRNATLKRVHREMPNIQLSGALAEFRAGNKNKGKQLLFTAIGRFPWVVARLLQELVLDAPPGVWGKEPRTEKEKFYSELYATRAKDLWNSPEMSALLIEVASAVQPDTPQASINRGEISQDEARHVLLSDVPALIALVPRHWTAKLDSSSDPLPPNDSINSYSSAIPTASRDTSHGTGRVSTTQMRHYATEIRNLHRFFEQLFPWYNQQDSVDGPDEANREDAPTTHDELMRQVENSNVSPVVFNEHLQRMAHIQDELLGGGVITQAGVLDRLAINPRLMPPEILEAFQQQGGDATRGPHQAHAEAASDSDE